MIGRPNPDCQSVLSGLFALLGISGVMDSDKILLSGSYWGCFLGDQIEKDCLDPIF